MTLVHFEPLTVSEIEVLKLMAQGYTVRETARKRGRSFKTIDAQLTSIRRKLQVFKTTQAVAIAMRQGIIT